MQQCKCKIWRILRKNVSGLFFLLHFSVFKLRINLQMNLLFYSRTDCVRTFTFVIFRWKTTYPTGIGLLHSSLLVSWLLHRRVYCSCHGPPSLVLTPTQFNGAQTSQIFFGLWAHSGCRQRARAYLRYLVSLVGALWACDTNGPFAGLENLTKKRTE